MSRKIAGIYMIKNLLNGKMYIGQSWDVFVRWRTHKSAASRTDSYLYNAIRKYGISSFSFSVIHEVDKICSQDMLDDLEIAYISIHGSTDRTVGYNIKSGGSKGKLAQETKDKISQKARGRKPSEETREKMSRSGKGRIFTDEHKEKIGLASKKHRHSEETKARISAKAKNRKASEATRKILSLASSASKAITNVDTGITYRTIQEAAKSCGSVGVYGMAKCADGKREKAKGYRWAWAEKAVANV